MLCIQTDPVLAGRDDRVGARGAACGEEPSPQSRPGVVGVRGRNARKRPPSRRLWDVETWVGLLW